LLVVAFGLRDLGECGVGIDNAKLVQRARLVGTLFVLSGQDERLACVLQGLIAVSRKPTDLAEPGKLVGMGHPF